MNLKCYNFAMSASPILIPDSVSSSHPIPLRNNGQFSLPDAFFALIPRRIQIRRKSGTIEHNWRITPEISAKVCDKEIWIYVDNMNDNTEDDYLDKDARLYEICVRNGISYERIFSVLFPDNPQRIFHAL